MPSSLSLSFLLQLPLSIHLSNISLAPTSIHNLPIFFLSATLLHFPFFARHFRKFLLNLSFPPSVFAFSFPSSVISLHIISFIPALAFHGEYSLSHSPSRQSITPFTHTLLSSHSSDFLLPLHVPSFNASLFSFPQLLSVSLTFYIVCVFV